MVSASSFLHFADGREIAFGVDPLGPPSPCHWSLKPREGVRAPQTQMAVCLQWSSGAGGALDLFCCLQRGVAPDSRSRPPHSGHLSHLLTLAVEAMPRVWNPSRVSRAGCWSLVRALGTTRRGLWQPQPQRNLIPGMAEQEEELPSDQALFAGWTPGCVDCGQLL